jgi:hypothetical protein
MSVKDGSGGLTAFAIQVLGQASSPGGRTTNITVLQSFCDGGGWKGGERP